MAKQREAYAFLFTDWHLQTENSGRKPEEWQPFAQNDPPDSQSVRQLVDTINQRFDEYFSSEFASREKLSLRPSVGGVDLMDSHLHPQWQKIWAVLVDRHAVNAKDNQDKLRLLGSGVAEAMKERENSLVYLFVLPKGDRTIPEGIKVYVRGNFVHLPVDQPADFVTMVATLLSDAAQKAPKPVRDIVETIY